MTVKELISQLETLDEDMKVCVSAQYGGYNEADNAEVIDIKPNPNFQPGDREGELVEAEFAHEKEGSVKVVTIW